MLAPSQAPSVYSRLLEKHTVAQAHASRRHAGVAPPSPMRPIFVAEGDRSDTQRVHMNAASLVLNHRAATPDASAPVQSAAGDREDWSLCPPQVWKALWKMRGSPDRGAALRTNRGWSLSPFRRFGPGRSTGVTHRTRRPRGPLDPLPHRSPPTLAGSRSAGVAQRDGAGRLQPRHGRTRRPSCFRS